MKKLLLVLLCLPMIGFGQDDKIIFSSGDTIIGKVIEVGVNDITYQHKGETTNNIIKKRELAKVIYSSGRIETFQGLKILEATPSAVTYSIGDTAQGGIVFYVSPDGKNGLVAATVDQSTSSNWYNASDVISSPLNHTLEGQKFLDWRLPTKDELNQMYLNIGQGNALGLGNIGGFASDAYWSSSEYDSYSAWGQSFYDGGQNFINKNIVIYFNVRAVRAF